MWHVACHQCHYVDRDQWTNAHRIPCHCQLTPRIIIIMNMCSCLLQVNRNHHPLGFLLWENAHCRQASRLQRIAIENTLSSHCANCHWTAGHCLCGMCFLLYSTQNVTQNALLRVQRALVWYIFPIITSAAVRMPAILSIHPTYCSSLAWNLFTSIVFATPACHTLFTSLLQSGTV